MVLRVYVEKKPGFDVEAAQLFQELRELLGISALKKLRIINRYDVEGIGDELFAACIPTVFSEPQTDHATQTLEAKPGETLFAVEYLPGQFDQRAESASECIQLISQGERPMVRSAKAYLLQGDLSEQDVAAIKHYVINPVEAREASLDMPQTLKTTYPEPAPVEVLTGFRGLSQEDLAKLIVERGLAMDLADIAFCQEYFASEERDPTITEIKMIDTYWSDHCRHTTFGTALTDVQIDDAVVQKAFDRYMAVRRELGRDDKPVCLMDMGTIGAKYLKAKGILKNLDESEEINACTVKIACDVDGEQQDWLFLFKNETHNHPTEIEPFGGAATCVGGAIRDPLSGRSYVYQAMRVTGAGDPLAPVSQTIPGKLPQRKLVTTAAAGYSSYGNQIGLATGQVHEIYHPGYVAKRMEIGAVVGATPAKNVRRERPAPGDVVVLLGGRTGRDGIGGATGSSKAHNAESLEDCGAEVQKGNPPIERKLQRLFRRNDACRLIKRCNDFGAGGVSVAIGELADGVYVELDRVPKKYDGLDGTELAISESQERMAVALAASDVEEFIGYAHEENLEATPVACVTQKPRVKMTWRGDTIVDISREFLASNGAPKQQAVHIERGGAHTQAWPGDTIEQKLMSVVTDINVCSNKGLGERFDSTIGAATVLMPFGGKTQLTPSMAMVSKLPVNGETTTTSGMAWGFDPYLMSANQFCGAYMSVAQSVAKLVCAGFKHESMYLTFQEYFEKLRDDPARWGKPAGAVLGALMAQLDLGIGSIGGKDSMSGSFEDLDVPPTLVSFAVGIGSTSCVCSPEFKGAGHRVVLIRPQYDDSQAPVPMPSAKGLLASFELVERLIEDKQALAVSTPCYGGVAEALFKMCVGNQIGFAFDESAGSAGCGAGDASGAENASSAGVEAGVDAEGATTATTAAPAKATRDEDILFSQLGGAFIAELAPEAQLPQAGDEFSVELLGATTQAYELVADGQAIDLAAVQEAWEAKLEPVFPYRQRGQVVPTVSHTGSQHRTNSTSGTRGLRIAKPRVVIPVFPGTNCEYDTAHAFERAGAIPEVFVINNLSPAAVAQSTQKLAELIGQSQIVMIPGGFSGGDEPDGSAKFICAFFRAPQVTQAVRELLQDRDGLMLGICNGFQALIKLGLVPFGDIRPMDSRCPTLTFNTIGRHQSKLVHTRICSDLSPWLSKCSVGDIHTIPISHGEGRFVADDELLVHLKEAGQIATQYVDAGGVPSMDWSVNPNGSTLAIEGITSPDGKVLGKMGHSERVREGCYQNVPGNMFQPIIEGGVAYFAE